MGQRRGKAYANALWNLFCQFFILYLILFWKISGTLPAMQNSVKSWPTAIINGLVKNQTTRFFAQFWSEMPNQFKQSFALLRKNNQNFHNVTEDLVFVVDIFQKRELFETFLPLAPITTCQFRSLSLLPVLPFTNFSGKVAFVQMPILALKVKWGPKGNFAHKRRILNMYYWRRGKKKKPEWKEKWELCFWEKNVCQKRSHEFYRHLPKLQSKGQNYNETQIVSLQLFNFQKLMKWDQQPFNEREFY